MMQPSRARLYLVLAALATGIVGLDQATKQIALDTLADGSVVLIDGVLRLRLAFNPGGAFGLLQGLPGFFLVATIVVAGLIIAWARHVRTTGMAVALGLVLGGGLGNLYDRLFRDFGGRVVDFVDLYVWPVFNLADSAIVVGVVLIIVFGTRGAEEDSPEDRA